MHEVTQLLQAIERGETRASEELLPIVYDELRRLAASKMLHEQPGQTLQATALVHEAYLRLVDGDPDQGWDNRGHFFAAAAEAMRRILIENARRKQAVKHGGDMLRADVDVATFVIDPEIDERLLALDEALDRLAEQDGIKADLVKLKYFAGLTTEQAASALGISTSTAERYWSYAKAWLHREMAAAQNEG